MTFVRTSILSLALVTGVAFAAHAQSGSVAALPPGAAPAPAPAAVAPSARLPGPNPGSAWSAQGEKQTQAVTPSPAYPGPRPH